jgi:hypothetical protein
VAFSAGFVTIMLGVGAGAIALWIDVRFPRLAPRDVAKIVLHAAASILLGVFAARGVEALAAAEDPQLSLAAIFGLAFPAIVYSLLAAIWVIKLTQQMLGGHLR